MKIEFVKETKADGGAYYFTQVDNRFVDKSLSYKMEEAKKIHDQHGKTMYKEHLSCFGRIGEIVLRRSILEMMCFHCYCSETA